MSSLPPAADIAHAQYAITSLFGWKAGLFLLGSGLNSLDFFSSSFQRAILIRKRIGSVFCSPYLLSTYLGFDPVLGAETQQQMADAAFVLPSAWQRQTVCTEQGQEPALALALALMEAEGRGLLSLTMRGSSLFRLLLQCLAVLPWFSTCSVEQSNLSPHWH